MIRYSKKKKKNKRVDLDIRPYPSPIFKNYDYGGPAEGNETSPGTGLYHGKMDKYKSVKEFIEKSRKRFRKRRRKAFLKLIYKIANSNYEKEWAQRIEELAANNPKPFNEWFGGKDRVYIAFSPDESGEEIEEINAYKDDVINALKDRYPDKCQEIDFVGGYCSQGNRKTRIGKLLNSAREKELKELQSKYDQLSSEEGHEFNPEFMQVKKELQNLHSYWLDIINAYTSSPLRAGVKRRKDTQYYVVISQNPHDLAQMSTGRNWTSCMELGKGSHHEDVFCEVEKGGLVAYLIKANDLQIQNPIARIHIRRFENLYGDSFARAENSIYGEEIPGFANIVDDWINEKQTNITPGLYRRVGGQYSDTFEESLTVAPSSPDTEDEMMRWLNAPHEVKGAIITYWSVVDDFQDNEDIDSGEEEYYGIDGIPLDKQFTDESEAHKYAEIMNNSKMNWNLIERLKNENIREISDYLTGSDFYSEDEIIQFLETDGVARDAAEHFDIDSNKPLSPEDAEKIYNEVAKRSRYGRYLDPSYERFKVVERKDDRTTQMQRAIISDVIAAKKGMFSKELLDSIVHKLFENKIKYYDYDLKELKNKFIDKYSNEYPEIYKTLYEQGNMDYDEFKNICKIYKNLESGQEKQNLGDLIKNEISLAIDDYSKWIDNNEGEKNYKYNILSGIQSFDRVPADLSYKVTDFAKKIFNSNKIEEGDKARIIANIVHDFSMTNSDTPNIQNFYKEMLPHIDVFPPRNTWMDFGEEPFKLRLVDVGYAIARLGENGKQFIPWLKQKFEEVKNWKPGPKDIDYYVSESKQEYIEKMRQMWQGRGSTRYKDKIDEELADAWATLIEEKSNKLHKFKKRQLETIMYIIDSIESGQGFSRKYNYDAR